MKTKKIKIMLSALLSLLAFVLFMCSMNTLGLFANASSGTPNAYSAANFTQFPDDWELDMRSDTTHLLDDEYHNGVDVSPKAQNGTLILGNYNGYNHGNDAAHGGSAHSINHSNYFGTMYNLAKNRTWGDFTFEMNFNVFDINAAVDRWFAVKFHTQENVVENSGRLSGYGFFIRFNGQSSWQVQKSTETSYVSRNQVEANSTNAMAEGTSHSLMITMEGMNAKAYLDGNYISTYDFSAEDSTIGTRHLTGGFSLVLNGCQIAISSVNIKDTVADVTDPPVAPTSATYAATANLPAYRADGTVTITAAEGNVPTSYRVLWGNGSGALSGYSAFQNVLATGITTQFTIAANTVVPEGADRLLVYSYSGMNGKLSDTPAVAILTGKSGDLGTVKSEFQVASDIHIRTAVDDKYNNNFASLLSQIKTISPNTSGLFLVGDITNGDDVDPKYIDAVPTQWTNFNTLITDSGFDKTKIYPTAGNHEYFVYGTDVSATRNENCIRDYLNGTSELGFNANSTRATGTTADKMYYYVDVESSGITSRFIMLAGLTCNNDNAAYLGETQRAWFANALANAPAGPIYVFLHQGLNNTVAGTKNLTGTLPVSTTDEAFIRAELKKYERAIYFSGHSHATLGADSVYVTNDLRAVNTSSVAYTSTNGSEALFVYTYEDKIVLKGRDLINQAWIPEAQLVVPTKHVHSLTHVEAAAATDAANGNIEYWYCTDCNKYFSDAAATDEITLTQTVIAKHKLQHVEAVAPTDKADGNIEYWYCATCNKYYSNQIGTAEITQAQTVIAKHTLQHVEAVAATETADGNIEYWYCEECDKYYSDADATTEITKADTVVTYEAGGCGSTLTGGSIFGSVMVVAVIVLAVIVLRKKRC